MKTFRAAFAAFLFCLTSVASFATINASLQTQLGNPSGAVADPNNHDHYLLQRPQYALDFNDNNGEPNWVSWDLTTDDVGSSGRSNNFIPDPDLPPGFYALVTGDYTGSGYDRGHMCPSADRTVSTADNQVTFILSNILPQTPDNNQGVWANFENYCRSLASAGNEILITSGGSIYGGSRIPSGKAAIPGYTWKIVLVVPLGGGTAVSRITSATRVIVLKIPNIAGVRSTPWQNFVTSIAQIETDTGFIFLTALDPATRSALRTVVDGQSAAGAPSIVAQPSPQTTVVGGSATFAVTASGDAPLSYQWFHDDNAIDGEIASTLSLAGVQAADVGNYYVVVTNSIGSATSNAAALIITGLPPVIGTPPASQTVGAGSNVTFSVIASGSPTLTYQWRKGGVPIAFATSATFTLGNVQSADTGSYDVVVANSVTSVMSVSATLTVNAASPTITGQPVSKTASTGSNASFTVVASGTAPLSYQWRKATVPLTDGGAVSGATTATLLLTGVATLNAGDYDVVVTNALGFATSNTASLTVNPPPPSTVVWDFGPAATPTANPTTGLTAEISGGTLTQGNNNGTTPLLSTTSASTPLSTFSGANNSGAAARVGPLVQTGTATTGSAYFEFTLGTAAGKRLLASGISFGMRSTGTGPQAFGVYTSLDSFATAVASGTVLNDSNWHLFTPSFATTTGPTGGAITFRIYGYNGAGSAGANTANWRMDDLKLTVATVFPPPVPPVVTGTTPAAGATDVDVTAPITITFNEAVSFSGSWFSIASAANGPIAATVTGGPTTIALTPPSAFANTDTITVTIFGAQVVDQATGTIHGTTNTTFSFTTQAFVPPTPPSVTTQPVAQTVNAGASANFTIAASGTAPLTYHWRKNAVNIASNPSASTATLTLTSVTLADAGTYDCVVTNVAGSDLSQPATLTVLVVPPTITTPPVAQSVSYGGSASLTVAASGTAPFSFQWRKNTVPIPGANTATLSLTGVTAADSASYDVIVSNSAGSATSAAATLAVLNGAPSPIYWDFATATPTSGLPAGVTDGAVTQGNNNGTTPLLTSTSASGGYTGSSGGNNAGAAARTGVLNQGGGGSAYFEFSFTAPAGRQFAATGVSFGMRSTGTGPQAFALFSSADGFTAPLASGVVLPDSAWHLFTPAFRGAITTAGGSVTFRLFGYNGAGSPGANTANWRLDDLKLTAGLLALPAVAPTVTTTSPAAGETNVALAAPITVTFDQAVNVSGSWFTITSAASGPITATVTGGPTTFTLTPNAAFAYGDTVTVSVIGAQVVEQATGTLAMAADYTFSFTTIPPVPPTITTQPVAQTVTVGDSVSFSVAASGTAPLSYQWRKGGVAVVGNPSATTDTLALAGVLTSDAGNYDCVVTNVAGFATSDLATLTVNKAPATVLLGGLTATYNGAPHGVTAVTVPAGLGVIVTYNGSTAVPVNAGSYAVIATIADPNYTGSATATLTINKAAATVTLGGLSQTYDGAPKSVTTATVPAGLSVFVTYDGSATAPTNVGSYAVAANVTNANYTGSATGTFTITAGSSTIVLGSLNQIYDGTPKNATATTTPLGLPVTFTYDGSATAPTAVGSYAVVGTINDPNYSGSATGTLVISTAALVRHAPTLNGGLDGSLQVLLPENTTFNSSAWVSGDLLVPGMPTVRLNGSPVYGGTLAGIGAALPSNYTITLNSGALLRHVVRRTDAATMPAISVPPAPTGTRNVSLNSATDNPGDFNTIRNLTLNSNAGTRTVPAGTYGTFTINGSSSLILGVAGAETPSVYNLQGLTINSSSGLKIVGPVIIKLGSGVSANGSLGDSNHPEWLALNIASGGLTINGSVTVSGMVSAPNGTVTINGGATLKGAVFADRLTINGNGLLDTIP